MRIYKSSKEQELEQLICNKCGKKIALQREIPREGVFQVRYAWGYMSEKDGMEDSFDLCEQCYDELTRSFQIPITRKEVTEYL